MIASGHKRALWKIVRRFGVALIEYGLVERERKAARGEILSLALREGFKIPRGGKWGERETGELANVDKNWLEVQQCSYNRKGNTQRWRQGAATIVGREGSGKLAGGETEETREAPKG